MSSDEPSQPHISLDPENQKYSIQFSKPRNSYDSISVQEPEKEGWFNRLLRNQFYLGNNIYTKYFGILVIVIVLYSFVFVLLQDEVLPQGDLFRLLVLVILAYIVGTLVSYIYLPPLLGMLLTGVVLKSVGFFHISGVYPEIVAVSRQIALCIILIKAGLGLDAPVLRRLKFLVMKLSVLPCLSEAIAAAFVAHFLLKFPWLWSFLLGFLLSPISPAVVVPTLLMLKEKGYGEDKGIATLVIAASSIDDVFSIAIFGVFLATTFSTGGSLAMQIIHGPLEIVLGIILGIVWGCIAASIPHKDDPHCVSKRVIMVGAGGVIAIVGSGLVSYEGSGTLCCITSAFVASHAWKNQGYTPSNHPVANVFSNIWVVMQPILFSLIGATIDVRVLEPKLIGYGLVVICIALAVRGIVCCLSVLGGTLNWKETIFLNLAWLPKATVQAALAPQPLTMLTSKGVSQGEEYDMAHFLLTTAVLAILITAPLGSIGINVSGVRLLSKKTETSS